MMKLHDIINENPTWFTTERSLFKPRFIQKFCVDIQGWALERIQKESIQTLQELQLRRLQKLIEHSYNSVFYWKQVLNKAGIKPEDIKCLKDLQKIPLTTKVNFKTIPIEERSSFSLNSSRYYHSTTSGSTGTPTPIVLDAWAVEKYIAIRERGIRWLYGSRKKGDLYVRILPRNEFYASHVSFTVPNFECLDKMKDKIYDICEKYNCIILSSPSIMFYLAQLTLKDKKNLSLQGIILSGEEVSTSMKEYIKKIFQCPTTSRYTCSEFGTLASECRYGNFHTNQDQQYIEVIDAYNNIPINEKKGKIVITDFNNFAMPFIRYEMGDIGTIYPNHQCECGLPFPIIEFIGRETSLIKLPDGTSNFVWNILKPLAMTKKRPWLLQFQMIQKNVNNFDIFVVTTNEETQNDICSIKNEMQWKLGMGAKLSIVKVPKLNVSNGTKLHSYISFIQTNNKNEKFN